MKLVVAGAVVLSLAGCASTVSGSPAGGPTLTTTAPTTTTIAPTISFSPRTTTTTTTSLAAPPTAIDENADQQQCPRTITGALGKKMLVVVVATPAGRVNCDQASAILVDYYGKRPNPDPASTPIKVDDFACNQVPKPDFPQVICADGASLFFSMWPQT
jgi:hypothetical protein